MENNSENNNYYMYLRKSRKDLEAEAHGEGETLLRHEQLLLSLAKRLNLTITKTFREIVSGETIAARPEMQKLLLEVEQGMCTGVLVVEIERLARGDTRDQGYIAEAFKYSNTKIITPLKVYDPCDPSDQEYFEFSLFMSRREYQTTRRRLNRGRLQSVQEGKYVGSVAPYGYQRKKLEREKGFTLVPDPDEAPIVKLIFEWFTGVNTECIGTSKIARKLNNDGVPTRKGGDWSPATIKGILENIVYIGKLYWDRRKQEKSFEDGIITISRPRSNNYTIVDGLQEPLIETEIFNSAQQRLNNHAPRVSNKAEIANPLAGIVVCSQCNRNMVRRPYGDRTKYDTLMCPNAACSTVSAPLYLVEEKLLGLLNIWLADYEPELIDSEAQSTPIKSEIKLKKKMLLQKNNELEKVNMQRNNLHDLLEQGIYTAEIFYSRSALLSQTEGTLKDEISSLKKEIAYLTAQECNKHNFAPRCKYLIDNYSDLTIESKNQLLRELLEKVVYTKTEKNKRGEGTKPNFELEIFPRVPQIKDYL